MVKHCFQEFEQVSSQSSQESTQVSTEICVGNAIVNGKPLSYIGITSVGLSFWPSYIANLLANIELCRCLSPKNKPTKLKVCYREVYDELITLCGFDHPVLDLLKLCFGNASALKLTLVILAASCRAPNTKRLCYTNISPYTRIADLYDAVNARLGAYTKPKPIPIEQLLALRKINLISATKLNLLRKLLSLDIGLYRSIRLFHNHPKMSKSFNILKRMKDNLQSVANLKAFNLMWFYNSFASDIVAIYQLSLTTKTCIVGEVSHTSNNRSLATSIFAYK